MKKRISLFKNSVQNFKINFKNKFQESKKKPRSKRKSFMIGFTTAVGIFGLTLFGTALSAFAQDKPNVCPKPTDIAPAPPAPVIPPTNEIINTDISGLAGSVCALAITSGAFAVGVVCGCIVVVGISHLRLTKE